VPGGTYGADALDTGGGLRPDLTGRGLGREALEVGLAFGRSRFAPRAF
jgi:ribosomal-protein-alanine N-acetyltransferase